MENVKSEQYRRQLGAALAREKSYKQRIEKLEKVNYALCEEINRQERVIESLNKKLGSDEWEL